MKTLRQIIDEGGVLNDTHVIAPGFIGFVNEEPWYIHSILDRTVVAAPPEMANSFDGRAVINFGAIMVYPQDIRWINRPRGETTGRQSVRRGYEKLRISRLAKAAAKEANNDAKG